MRRKNHLSIPDHRRRDFIKWSIGVGATLGLRPWKVFEATESVVGSAIAAEASCSSVTRFVGNNMGNGGFAWMTQLFPFDEIATQAGKSFYATGQSVMQLQEAGDHPLHLAPDGPRFGGRKISAFVCGSNETHTARPATALRVDTGVSLYAAVAALQTSTPTLVPAISIGQLPYGTAAGAPNLAQVADPQGMVGIFDSAASAVGATLSNPNDASMFEAFYKANLELHRAARLPTTLRSFRTGKVASNLLGKNLAAQLRPTPADLQRYGVFANTPAKLQLIANTLITTVKSFKLNLTSSVLLPGMNDDPHPAFNDLATMRATVTTMGKIWDAFIADLAAEDDPLCSGKKLADNTVIAWTGDTPKSPLTPNGWPDATPGNANWMFVLGNGYLRGGWFGQVRGNGAVETWNPTTGANVAGGTSAAMAGPASAAVLYAVTKGDMRRVQDFYRGQSISGVIVPDIM